MTRTTTVCPHCNKTRIYSKAGGIANDGDQGWHCRSCNQSFEEPERREVDSQGGIRRDTLAGQLDAANPEVVGQ